MSQLTRILSIDGGVFANNPALCTYAAARIKLSGRPTAREMAILSQREPDHSQTGGHAHRRGIR